MSSNLRYVPSDNPTPPRSASRVPTGGLYQPDRMASDLEQAAQEEAPTDGGRVLRRLLASGGVMMLVAGINFFVLRRYGLELPPYLLLTTFGVIATAGILACFAGEEQASDSQSERAAPAQDEGCAVGMCPGPRPPRFLRK